MSRHPFRDAFIPEGSPPPPAAAGGIADAVESYTALLVTSVTEITTRSLPRTFAVLVLDKGQNIRAVYEYDPTSTAEADGYNVIKDTDDRPFVRVARLDAGGFNPRGAYDGGRAYALLDLVTDQGSSWVYINATSGSGNAPPTLPTAVNAHWQLVSQKGEPGDDGEDGDVTEGAAADMAVAAATAAIVEHRDWPLYPSLSLLALPEQPLPSAVTFTRATTAYRVNAVGNYESIAIDQIRHAYDPATGAYRFWQIEVNAATNEIRNNSMQGASAPSTLPTNWSVIAPGGLTVGVVGVGTSKGMDYIDLRYAGTSNEVARRRLLFETGSQTVAAENDVWTGSMFLAVVDGDLTGVSSIELGIVWQGPGTASESGDIKDSLSDDLQRFSFSATAPASTTFTRLALAIACDGSSEIDFTIRIGWPQLEKGRSVPSSPIRTINAAVTRAADVMSVEADDLEPYLNASEGALFVEGLFEAISGVAECLVSIHAGAAANRINLNQSNGGSFFQVINNSVNQHSAVSAGTISADTPFGLIGAWEANNFAHGLDGGSLVEDSSGTPPSGLTTMNIGSRESAALPANFFLKHLCLFGRRPDNTDLPNISG